MFSIPKKIQEERKYFKAINKKDIGGLGKSPVCEVTLSAMLLSLESVSCSVRLAGPQLPLWPASLGGVTLVPGSSRSCPPPYEETTAASEGQLVFVGAPKGPWPSVCSK